MILYNSQPTSIHTWVASCITLIWTLLLLPLYYYITLLLLLLLRITVFTDLWIKDKIPARGKLKSYQYSDDHYLPWQATETHSWVISSPHGENITHKDKDKDYLLVRRNLSCTGQLSCAGRYCASMQQREIQTQFFVPPGSNHCWVNRGSMEWEFCQPLLYKTSSGTKPWTFWYWIHI